MQLNIEYFFRLLYDLFQGNHSVNATPIEAAAAHIWLWVTVIGYLVAIAGFAFIVYALIRIFDLRKHEEEYYGSLILAPETEQKNQRWAHIRDLAGGRSPSEWREAIIEADVMLDELLTRMGAPGASVAEKLRTLDEQDFPSLRDAWEAHRVRNQVAHEGSSFALSDSLTHRTIGHYEAVFREFGLI